MLAKLFRAIAEQDWQSAMQLARTVAGDEEKKGHRSAAQALRGSLNPNAKAVGNPPSSHGGTTSILSTALQQINQGFRLGDIVLSQKTRKALEAIILEWRNRHRLQAAGLRPRTKLLFHGPPGCGKSMTAGALGGELGIPTFVVRFDAVIGAFLGQTALHLRELFRYAELEPCVLVFDEIDALGKQRGNPLDVGELDRIVIALMQELEHCDVQGLIVATTNLEKNLDKALWRRFDLNIGFPAPTKAQRRAYVQRKARDFEVRIPTALRTEALTSKSFAEIEGLVHSEARRSILRGG